MADALDCGVCLEKFSETGLRVPLTLPQCGHTACKQCLLGLNIKVCPFCRSKIVDNVEKLPRNLALIGLLASEPKQCTDAAIVPTGKLTLKELRDCKAQQERLGRELEKTIQQRLRNDIEERYKSKIDGLAFQKQHLQAQVQALEAETSQLKASLKRKEDALKKAKRKRIAIDGQMKELKSQLAEELQQFRERIAKPHTIPKQRTPTPKSLKPLPKGMPTAAAPHGNGNLKVELLDATLPGCKGEPALGTSRKRSMCVQASSQVHDITFCHGSDSSYSCSEDFSDASWQNDSGCCISTRNKAKKYSTPAKRQRTTPQPSQNHSSSGHTVV